MRKVSKASEQYYLGEWNYCNMIVDGPNDKAEISILQHNWSKTRKFKVEKYSKGSDKWKIIEDADV